MHCNDNNIFLEEAGHFGGEEGEGGDSFYPSNTLDRTLVGGPKKYTLPCSTLLLQQHHPP